MDDKLDTLLINVIEALAVKEPPINSLSCKR